MTVYRPRTSPQPGTPSSPAINCLLPYYSENLPGAPQRSCPHTKVPVYCDYPSSRQVSVHLHSVLESVFENLSGIDWNAVSSILWEHSPQTIMYLFILRALTVTSQRRSLTSIFLGWGLPELFCHVCVCVYMWRPDVNLRCRVHACVCAHVETRCQSQV